MTAAKAPSQSSAVMYAMARHPNKVGNPPREREKVTMMTNGQEMIPPHAVRWRAMVGYRGEKTKVRKPPSRQATVPTVPEVIRSA